ncbi:MAG: 2Fe-2S ferredoxin [Bacillota bacterium]
MKKPEYHILVCTSSRPNGQQKGFCHTKSALEIINNFVEEIEERGLGGRVMVSNTGCFALCEKGPIVVIYPDNVWYGGVSPEDAEEIMDEHIEGGRIVKRLEITR